MIQIKNNKIMFVKHRDLIVNLDNVVKISLNNEFIIITPNHSDPDVYLEFKTMAFADMAFTELFEFFKPKFKFKITGSEA